MPTVPYSISVVIDGEYGARVSELARSGPVWIVDSPSNRAAAQSFWTQFPLRDHLDGITIFRSVAGSSPEDCLIGELGTIDLHHGTYSADPPYTVLEIVGSPLTERIKIELSKYGFSVFHDLPEGLRAIRQLPTDPEPV